MPIMKFSTDEEAVRLANDSRYGLGCAVFSGSQRRAKEIASQIHCGVAAINDFASTYMCQVCFPEDLGAWSFEFTLNYTKMLCLEEIHTKNCYLLWQS